MVKNLQLGHTSKAIVKVTMRVQLQELLSLLLFPRIGALVGWDFEIVIVTENELQLN